jgi:hypothetical protein
MSTVSDLVKCPQCGYEEADYEFNCRTREEETLCNRCGYRESLEAKNHTDGQLLGWKHEICNGFGALWYRSRDGIGFACHTLHTAIELAEAERWLKQQLEAGTVDEHTARLTRWNGEARTVELVLGTLDYAGTMEQAVAELGLDPLTCSPGEAARFAMLPGKAAVIGNSSCVIVPVLRYLNADPVTGRYELKADSPMVAIESEIEYLALSHQELNEINKLQEPEQSLYDIDVAMSVSSPDFGRDFRRVCRRPRWTLDPATEKQVKATIVDASSELATKCAGRPGVELFPDLRSAKQNIDVSKAAKSSARDQGVAGDVTDDTTESVHREAL